MEHGPGSREQLKSLLTPHIQTLMQLVRDGFVCVDTTATLSVVADDPADNRVLEAALASQARVIVTGDHHLLELRDWRTLSMLSPAAFVTTYLMR